jgi:uncharacterized membrane protein
MELEHVLILLHLIGFAAFLGAAFAQTQLIKLSTKSTGAVRDEHERLAASIMTKIELPGLFAQIITGALLLVHEPNYLKQHWMHAKLGAIAVILVLAHVEMINARKIVKARAARGEAANEEIAARKKTHAVYGAVGTVFVVAVLLLATVLRHANW